MNRIALLAAGCAAFALAACDHPDAARQRKAAELKVVSKLDCPQTQGQLTRTEAAADGRSCLYTTKDGTEVTLSILALNGGTPSAALAPIETELKALIPASQDDASKVKVTTDAASGDEDVEINLPGISIKTEGENARVKVAGAEINAEDGRAEVRAGRNISETSDAKDPRRSAVSARYILANDEDKGLYRAVGYEAHGPKGGPLVVGKVKVKTAHNTDDLFDDVSDLIRHNVGGDGKSFHVIVD